MEKEFRVENQTDFRYKCEILAKLWLDYREDEDWQQYIEYNDLGLPIAYMVANGLFLNEQIDEVTEDTFPIAANFVNEAFRLLLTGLDIKEDVGFEVLEDVLDYAEDSSNKSANDGE